MSMMTRLELFRTSKLISQIFDHLREEVKVDWERLQELFFIARTFPTSPALARDNSSPKLPHDRVLLKDIGHYW